LLPQILAVWRGLEALDLLRKGGGIIPLLGAKTKRIDFEISMSIYKFKLELKINRLVNEDCFHFRLQFEDF